VSAWMGLVPRLWYRVAVVCRVTPALGLVVGAQTAGAGSLCSSALLQNRREREAAAGAMHSIWTTCAG
jgi:hypothetical protein